VVVAILASVLSFLIARRIIQPVQTITETAGVFGAGDLMARAPITSDDEMGVLAGAFNNMARQLRDRVVTLERHAAEQTKALATFREVSRLSAMLDEKQLVTEVVDRVKDAFHYYHATIYFYDEAKENLVMAGGTGESAQKYLSEGNKIPKGKGPVGRAAETNTPVLVGDISREPGWHPNPMFPKTKSELAVPIAVGDQVLGVLDVQQNILNGMTQVDASLLQSIAHQLALAVRNARAYTPSRQQAEREALIASLCQKILETTSVEEALRVAVRELGLALDSRETRVVLSVAPSSGPADAESKPEKEK
jgi:nitrate/nitrite-specific signal transduction histidine kinase